MYTMILVNALVVKLVDTKDLKSYCTYAPVNTSFI